MRIKVGSKIYDSEKQPLMVILNTEEKCLIAHMAPDSHKFCVYPKDYDRGKVNEFMQDENSKRRDTP